MSPQQPLEFHIGDRLRKAREVAGYDRKAFAAKIEVAPNTVRAYESGRTSPKFSTLAAWSLATGYSVAELVGDTNPPSPDGGLISRESSSACTRWGVAPVVDLRHRTAA